MIIDELKEELGLLKIHNDFLRSNLKEAQREVFSMQQVQLWNLEDNPVLSDVESSCGSSIEGIKEDSSAEELQL